MSRTREDFCRKLLDDDSPHDTLNPEGIAARFVRYFRLSGRPAMDDLRIMLRRAGFGEVTGRHLDVKGIHYSAPGGGYDIHYRDDLWGGGQEFTVVHETYEIIHETLWDMNSGDAPDRRVCREADRFAAAVLMQPRAFEPLALESGLDVPALQRAFRCSYASVTIRLAEVLRRPPFMAILYEREDEGDPAGWTEPPDFRATVVRRTRGFGTAVPFPISGFRGGVPRRGRPLPDGSLAEQAVRYGTARYAHDGGYAVIARPVVWKGKLAKVVVIAVPDADGAVLNPQVIASDMPARRRRPVPTVAAVGPWQRSKAGSLAIGADVRTA